MTVHFSGLLKAESPFFHLMQAPLKTFETESKVWEALPGVTYRLLDGEQCKTAPDLMRHFEQKLGLPEYFSHNWDSLDECLTDLEWLPTRHVVFSIYNASQMLCEEPEAREYLSEILWITGEAWAEASDEITPMSFHVILQDENDAELKAWVTELQAHGATSEAV